MSNDKRVIRGIPRRPPKQQARYPQLPPAHTIVGGGYRSPLVGFLRRAYPRIAYSIENHESSRPDRLIYELRFVEWVKGERIARVDLDAGGFASLDACYAYIDDLQKRFAENNDYQND